MDLINTKEKCSSQPTAANSPSPHQHCVAGFLCESPPYASSHVSHRNVCALRLPCFASCFLSKPRTWPAKALSSYMAAKGQLVMQDSYELCLSQRLSSESRRLTFHRGGTCDYSSGLFSSLAFVFLLQKGKSSRGWTNGIDDWENSPLKEGCIL